MSMIWRQRKNGRQSTRNRLRKIELEMRREEEGERERDSL